MSSSQMHPWLVRSVLYLHLFSFILQTSFSQDRGYRECSPTQIRCGSVFEIRFPFWIQDRWSNCGYPGFRLTCEGDNTLVTEMRGQKYQVKAIDYENQMATVVRKDLIGKTCPLPSDNTTLDFSRFGYAPGVVNVTIYHDCSSSISDGYYAGFSLLPCFSGAYFTMGTPVPPDTGNVFGNCRATVLSMFQLDVRRVVEIQSHLSEVLEGGFNVTWTVGTGWCSECRRSGGHCGYTVYPELAICFCRDQPHLRTCLGSPISTGENFSQKIMSYKKGDDELRALN